MAINDRRQREKENRRIEVLKTALGLFSENGYSNVSMDLIALKAELSKPTLYQYFNNKAELFSSIILELGFDFVELNLRASQEDGQDPTTDLTRMRESFKELCLGKPRKVFLLYLSISRKEIASELSAQTLLKMRERLEGCLKIVEEVFQRGMREKYFIKHDPREATQTLWAISIGLSQMMETESLMKDAGIKSNTDIPALYDVMTGKYFESILIKPKGT